MNPTVLTDLIQFPINFAVAKLIGNDNLIKNTEDYHPYFFTTRILEKNRAHAESLS